MKPGKSEPVAEQLSSEPLLLVQKEELHINCANCQRPCENTVDVEIVAPGVWDIQAEACSWCGSHEWKLMLEAYHAK